MLYNYSLVQNCLFFLVLAKDFPDASKKGFIYITDHRLEFVNSYDVIEQYILN